MHIRSAILTFSIPYATSLKDKRQVKRSLVDRVRKRFNVSIAEVATQDAHRTLTIGLTLVSGDADHAQQSMNSILDYMEETTEAELLSIEEV